MTDPASRGPRRTTSTVGAPLPSAGSPWRDLGIRGRLFLISFALLVAVGVPGSLLATRWANQEAQDRALEQLLAEARLTAEAVAASAPLHVEAARPLLERLAATTGARFTLLNGAGRPIATAGSAQSADDDTLTADAPGPGHAFVVRATRAAPQDGWGLALFGGTAALLGLVVAGVMSGLAAALASRELRGLVVSAAHLARGERQRVPLGGGGEVEQLAGSFNRLSEQLESSLGELAASRERLEAVLESMQEALVVLDGDRRVVLVNAAAQRLFGLAHDVEGRALVDVVRTLAVHALVERGFRATDDASVPLTEVELPRRPAPPDEDEDADGADEVDGDDRAGPLLVQLRCRRLPDDRGLLLVASDVTEVRRLETIRRDFVANVSHELRTPVAVIRVNAETLAAGALTDSRRASQFVTAIHRNAERLSSLISDLLDLSRIESGRWALETQPISALAVAQRVVSGLSPTIEARHATVVVTMDAGRRVLGDARALDQILSNLIENALKHSQDGCRVEISDAPSATPGRVRITIEDDGPGIAAPHRERVFERFYRVDPGRSRAVGGTGLGLAIVRHLAEGMDGTVGLDAREPTGSRFWLELPLAPT